MSYEKEIVNIAKKYIGKTEKPNNSGFNDAEFEKKMKDVGWDKGMAWCSYFAELVWTESYVKDILLLSKTKKLFSGSATATFKNFQLDKWETGSTPKVGAVVIWRHGVGWQGHAGIVISVSADGSSFNSIEGNTNDKGGREGYIVSEKIRKTKTPFSNKGLNLVGFIYPK